MPDAHPQQQKKWNRLAIVSFVILISIVLYCVFYFLIDIFILANYICTKASESAFNIRNKMSDIARVIIWFLIPVSFFGFTALHQIKKNHERGHGIALWSAGAVIVALALFVSLYIVNFSTGSGLCTF